MKLLPPLAIAALAIATPTAHALAWGVEGHAIIADIAEAHLTEAAHRQVRLLLDAEGKTNLDQISSWADMVRMQRRETSSWHYVNIPLEAPVYDPSRDCPGGQCVVQKIYDFAHVLSTSADVTRERLEALKWVVHFVGDIHQPLHAEDHGDEGGNAIPVIGFGSRANLHRLWDTDFIRVEINGDERSFAHELDRGISPDQIRTWQNSRPADWANESHHVAQSIAYGLLPRQPDRGRRQEPEAIDEKYEQAATKAINARLQQAGIRLADVLNQVLR